jgi:hypothetical protein
MNVQSGLPNPPKMSAPWLGIAQSLDDIEATITGLAHNEQVTDAGHLPPGPVYQLTDQGSVNYLVSENSHRKERPG